MELFFNLAWLVVAGALVALWLRGNGQTHPERRGQVIAMAVLIAILFPVISVSDDLQALQNASEADNYLRRDHLVPSNQSTVQPMLAVILPVMMAGLGFGFLRFIAPSLLSVLQPKHPEIAGIENRPPPVA
jgi:hypothetical protein